MVSHGVCRKPLPVSPLPSPFARGETFRDARRQQLPLETNSGSARCGLTFQHASGRPLPLATDRAVEYSLQAVLLAFVPPARKVCHEKSDHVCRRRSCLCEHGLLGHHAGERTIFVCPASEPRFAIPAGARFLATGGRPEGGNPRTIHAPQPGLPGHSAHVLGLRPAQYDPAAPAALMVFQDGQAFKDEKGDMRAQNVMDNLIYRREIPVMIGVFINPGRRPGSARAQPEELGRPRHQPADRVQLSRRQVCTGDHRRADARPAQGIQHFH